MEEIHTFPAGADEEVLFIEIFQVFYWDLFGLFTDLELFVWKKILIYHIASRKILYNIDLFLFRRLVHQSRIVNPPKQSSLLLKSNSKRLDLLRLSLPSQQRVLKRKQLVHIMELILE